MKTKLIGGSSGDRTYLLVLDTGDEVTWCLGAFAEGAHLTGHFTAIGALREATIAYWNPETLEYEHNPVREQVEVVSFAGTVAVDAQGKWRVHGHIVLGDRQGNTKGGHLVKGYVNPTLEIVFTEAAVRLERAKDERTGLSLLKL